MTVIASLTFSGDAFELGRVLRPEPRTRLDLVDFVPIGGEQVPYFWVTGAPERLDAFERRVSSESQVASLRRMDEAEGQRLYRVTWNTFPGEEFAAIREHDGEVESASGTQRYWIVEVRFPDRERLVSFEDHCREAGMTVTVDSVDQPGLEPFEPLDLTDTQREALVLAREKGYFEKSREVTLEQLGDELGISRQAVSYRLRGGIETLIDQTIRSGS